MHLAALYQNDSTESQLYVEVNGGYIAVDDLALEGGSPHLSGLHDVGELFELGPDAIHELDALDWVGVPPVAEHEARFAPPIRKPGKIICVGLNYLAHIEESLVSRPSHIVLFSKYSSCLVGHRGEVVRPKATKQLDYEGELAVIIGRRARGVGAGDASEYIGGFTIINDISARDLQVAEPQWVRGKALDTFAPLGPIVVDRASAPEIEEMHITTLVNGELRQDASCSLMITPVEELVEYISRDITLEPGDLIATGTPAGVAFGMANPVYLANGDEVTVTISGIGTLSSFVRAVPSTDQ